MKLRELGGINEKRLEASVFVIVAILAVAGASAVYFSEPSIRYWQGTSYEYQRLNGGWVTYDCSTNETTNGTFTTFYCQNRAVFDVKFDLMVQLTNASFQDNSNPNIGGAKATLPFTLHGMETNSTRLYFLIGENATGFAISLSVKTSQLLVRSTEANWDGQNPIMYEKFSDDKLVPVLIC